MLSMQVRELGLQLHQARDWCPRLLRVPPRPHPSCVRRNNIVLITLGCWAQCRDNRSSTKTTTSRLPVGLFQRAWGELTQLCAQVGEDAIAAAHVSEQAMAN